MNLVIGCDSLLMAQAVGVRAQVIVGESPTSHELGLDGKDLISQHAILYDGMQVVGAARLILSDGYAELSRVVVVKEYCGKQLSSILVESLIKYARKQKVTVLTAYADSHLTMYYQTIGFEFIQQVREGVEGARHSIEMRMNLHNERLDQPA
ncbi:GNAT family N-acetyltransferase [Vibrio kasasachensis]|uniref:GNAT family N-acetyltransferase n=1 Tax=Vibrio kasasachensis TaxID=2910248 RepID=UPI003D115763